MNKTARLIDKLLHDIVRWSIATNAYTSKVYRRVSVLDADAALSEVEACKAIVKAETDTVMAVLDKLEESIPPGMYIELNNGWRIGNPNGDQLTFYIGREDISAHFGKTEIYSRLAEAAAKQSVDLDTYIERIVYGEDTAQD